MAPLEESQEQGALEAGDQDPRILAACLPVRNPWERDPTAQRASPAELPPVLEETESEQALVRGELVPEVLAPAAHDPADNSPRGQIKEPTLQEARILASHPALPETRSALAKRGLDPMREVFQVGRRPAGI